MATLALVCGHHLTVATAGTLQAHIDTGSQILLVHTALLLLCMQLVGPSVSG